MNRGEIWWYESPWRKRRPVCILTRQPAIAVLERLVIAPATGTIRGLPTEVRLSRDLDGVPHDCVLTFDNLKAVRKVLLTEHITTLEEPRLSQLCVALKTATGC